MFANLSGNLEAARQKAMASAAMAREHATGLGAIAANPANMQAIRARTTQNLGTLRNNAALGLTSAKSFAGQQLSKLAPAVDNTLSSLKTTVLTLVGNIRDSPTLQSVLAKWNELDAAVRAQLNNEIQAANVPYTKAGRKRTRRHKRKGRK
uniref:Uncharacterized protein n=1 Tax=viral metagenome TaxID=1070528 RepID=A0A6C0CGB7_9ZZZZ